MSALV